MLDRSPPSALEASSELCNLMTTPKNITHEYTRVQREYKEYNPTEWMNLISSVNSELGRSGKRWQWIMNNELSQGNSWVVDFYFEHPHDATLFQLKY